MSQPSRRSQRDRKPTRRFGQDEENSDRKKNNRQSNKKDQRTHAQLSNQLANIFVKFMNNANQRVSSFEPEGIDRSMDEPKAPQPEDKRNNTGNQQPTKKEAQAKEIQAILISKAQCLELLQLKEKGNTSGANLSQSEISTNRNNDSQSLDNLLKKYHQAQAHSKKREETRERKQQAIKRAGQISELQYKRLKKIKESQIFKRSSYHVAISYKIYFNQLRKKNPLGEIADPTLQGRKRIKEEKEKRQVQQKGQ